MKRLIIHIVNLIKSSFKTAFCITFFCYVGLLFANCYAQETKKNDTLKVATNKSIHTLLQENSEHSYIYKKLYEWLVVSKDSNISANELLLKTDDEYEKYNQKIIRYIKVKQVSPFARNILDTIDFTTNNLEKTLTRLRFETKKSIINNNLTFKNGEFVNIQNIKDSERIIRSLSFITDAMILIEPASKDTSLVDILVITQDSYPYGGELSLSTNEAKVKIYSKNVLGYGVELSHSITTTPTKNRSFGYSEELTWNNIYGSFITFSSAIADNNNDNFIKFGAQKKFLTPDIKYAGGLSLQKNFKVESSKSDSVNFLNNNYDYLSPDFWIGRSFLINAPNYFDRSNIGIMGQVKYNEYYNLPDTSENKPWFIPNTYIFGSVSFSKRNYYKNTLIYNYGRIEDVPYGFLTALSIGYNHNTIKSRIYTGAHFSIGSAIIPNKGYIYFSGDINSFFYQSHPERTITNLLGRYISNLRPIGNNLLRSFVSVNYVRGMHMQYDDYIYLNESNSALSAYSSKELWGTQKLVLKTENVFFTPSEINGFKMAFFSFYDMGWITHKDQLLTTKPYYSIGGGIRIRNDHLVFNTIQIQLAYFPRIPPGGVNFNYRLSGEDVGHFKQFDMPQPYVDVYE